jgi:ferredoxin-NADP reductase
MIDKYVNGELGGKVFYVCGPPPMMNALIAALIEHGVPSRQVRSERFAL